MVDRVKQDTKDPFERLYEAMAVELQDEYLSKPHDKATWKYTRRPPLRFRASESGGCPRRIWYRLMGFIQAPDSPDLRLKQMEGNLQQDVVRSLMERYGIKVDGIIYEKDGTQTETIAGIKEFTVEMPDGSTEIVKVSARADGRFLDTPVGRALFEFKTVDHFKAYWLQKALDSKGTAGAIDRIYKKHSYYSDQMQISMAIFDEPYAYFGFKNRSNVSYGLLNDDHKRNGLYLKRDEAKIQEILQTFGMVQRCVKSETPPEGYLDGSMECSWCPFYYQCHGKSRRQQRKLEPAVVYPGTETE